MMMNECLTKAVEWWWMINVKHENTQNKIRAEITEDAMYYLQTLAWPCQRNTSNEGGYSTSVSLETAGTPVQEQ